MNDHPGRADEARAEAIGEHAGAGAEQEVDQAREAEDERDVGALGRELAAERAEERGERIGDAEDDRDARRTPPDDDHASTRSRGSSRRDCALRGDSRHGTSLAPVSCSCASTSDGTYFLPWPSALARTSDWCTASPTTVGIARPSARWV